MKCIEVEKQLNFLADGEIDFSQKEDVEHHLQNCPLCQNVLERLQFVGTFLKQPVAAPPTLDERVLDAFQTHHANKKPVLVIEEKRRGFFGKIFIPIPVFTLVLALFALTIGAAYQLGKSSAANINLPVSETAKTESLTSESYHAVQTPLVKYVEVPVTKIVRVPVFKEKPINRIVYKIRTAEKYLPAVNSKEIEAESSEKKNSQYVTELFNLQGFQTVSELKLKIIKKEEKQ